MSNITLVIGICLTGAACAYGVWTASVIASKLLLEKRLLNFEEAMTLFLAGGGAYSMVELLMFVGKMS